MESRKKFESLPFSNSSAEHGEGAQSSVHLDVDDSMQGIGKQRKGRFLRTEIQRRGGPMIHGGNS